jgi:hypothetical protein
LAQRVTDRYDSTVDEIISLGGEVFVPQSIIRRYRDNEAEPLPKKNAEWNAEAYVERENLKRARKLPLRAVIEPTSYYGKSVRFDESFFRQPLPQRAHDSALDDLAIIGEVNDWEQGELKNKLNNITKKKLALGARFYRIMQRSHSVYARLHRISRLLTHVLGATGYLPSIKSYDYKSNSAVILAINSRQYVFATGENKHGNLLAFFPLPEEKTLNITVDPTPRVDATLLGKSVEHMLNRLGLPSEDYHFRRKGKAIMLCAYDSGCLLVEDRSYGAILEVMTHEQALPALLRWRRKVSAAKQKPRRKKKRSAKCHR